MLLQIEVGLEGQIAVIAEGVCRPGMFIQVIVVEEEVVTYVAFWMVLIGIIQVLLQVRVEIETPLASTTVGVWRRSIMARPTLFVPKSGRAERASNVRLLRIPQVGC